MLKPGERYFRHDRESWPTAPELGFDIYTERLEDQLAAEANAVSPLDFEDDDKENDIDAGFEETRNFLDGIFVVPASQYRPANEDGHTPHEYLSATGAFYDTGHSTLYGLGGSDGAHDEDHVTAAKPISDALGILASDDQRPRSPYNQNPADEIDSVLGLSSSNAVGDVDSVCGF
jgi:hypothetical protein